MLRERLIPLMVYILVGGGTAFAQSGNLTGTVTDAETGETLPGSNVLIVEISRGASADTDGSYEIRNINPGNYTVRITFIGYQTLTQEVQITAGQETVFNAALEVGSVGLDELIVTGYGVESKRELTGSISSVSSDEFSNIPVQNVESILQGRAAGVQVTTSSGNPGGAFQVRVRGNGSINAASEPLYIVDGVQISFSNQSELTSSSPLNAINPNDIESIEVLKDAAAAAIYGSQAASGVVLITTKRGVEGRTQITARAETGLRTATQRVGYLNSAQWAEYGIEAWQNDYRYLLGQEISREQAQAFLINDIGGIYGYGASATLDDLQNFNWQDYIYDQGIAQKYNISASGGGESTTFYLSAGLENTEGHVFGSNFDRYSLRANVDHQFTSRLQGDVNIGLTRSNQFGICQDGNFINCPPAQAMFEPPFSFPYLENGEYNPNTAFGLSTNPAVVQNEVERQVGNVQVLGDVSLNYQFTDWLNLSTTFGLDYRDISDERYDSPIANPSDGGAISRNFRTTSNTMGNIILSFRQSFDEIHNISGLAGSEYRREFFELVSTRGIGFPGSLFDVLNASATPTDASGFNSEFRLASYLGQIKYNYDERYYLAIVGRYDGHSRFGADTRWGLFPSVSGAWAVSEEDFFNVGVIEDLKIRVGYGTTGNANIGNFAARGLFAAEGSYIGNRALVPDQLPNADLGWEEAQEINLGLDYSLFDGRLYGSVDVYQRKNKNLLLDRNLPLDSGYGIITENIGSIRNRGLEFEINSANISRRDFAWNTRFNVAFQGNEILELSEGQDRINAGDEFQTLAVGHPIGVIFVPKWAGVNPADGRPMWYNADGNLTYTPTLDDYDYYKDGVQDMIGGLGNTFNYKDISLDVFFQFSFGQWAFANTDWYFTRTYNMYAQFDDMVLDRWREPGDITYVPRATTGETYPGTASYRTQLGTHSIYNASYIRLKSVTLSYELPALFIDRVGLAGIRLYASGINLMTWTNWPYYDPEVSFDTPGDIDIYNNLVAASYPSAMQVNAGIEVRF